MPSQRRVSRLMHFGTLLQAHGVCPAAILRKLDIPPSLLLDPDGWIDRRLSFRLATEMSRAIDDRFAGAHYAELQRLEEYARLWPRHSFARTLKDAVLFAIREIEQIDDRLRLLLDLDRPNAYWSFEYQATWARTPSSMSRQTSRTSERSWIWHRNRCRPRYGCRMRGRSIRRSLNGCSDQTSYSMPRGRNWSLRGTHRPAVAPTPDRRGYHSA